MKNALLALANLALANLATTARTSTSAPTARPAATQLVLAGLLVALASCGGGGANDAPPAPGTGNGGNTGGGNTGGGNTGGGNNGGGNVAIDARLIGRWENQEILQSNTSPVSFTVINVDRLTFAPDLTGSIEEFSIVNGAPGQISRSNFTWPPIAAGAIRVTEQGFAPADLRFAFTTDGNGMQIGSKVFTRLN